MASDINKKKITILSSIMNDPKLSKTIKEALAAPIGSTKRDRTRALVSIMKKSAGVPDGKGGPGMNGYATSMSMPTPLTARNNNNVPPFKSATYGNVTIFPPAPKIKMSTGTGPSLSSYPSKSVASPMLPDGKGGPGDMLGSSPTPDYSKLNLGNINLANLGPGTQSAPKTVTTPSATQSNIPGSSPFKSMPNLSRLSVSTPDFSAVAGSTLPPTMKTNPYVTAPSYAVGFSGDFASKYGGQPPVEESQTKIPTKLTHPPAIPPREDSGVVAGAQSGTDTSKKTETPVVTPTPTKDSSAPQFDSLRSAVQKGTGAAAYAFGAMNDIEALKKMFPGIPEDQLPVGASLTKQITDLDKALKDEYKLDTLLNNKQNLDKRGATLTSDLSDYIRGRDEYLNHIDGMLNVAKDAMFEMDMANPEVASRMSNYTKYLTVLKGRQNQRYIDFLDSSIAKHNAEVADASQQYENAVKSYENELKLNGELTTEDYNRWYAILSDMYTTLDNAESKALDLRIKEQELYNAQIKAIVDATKAAGDAKDVAYYKQVKEIEPYIIDQESDTKALLDNADITNVINTFQPQGIDPRAVVLAFEKNMNASLRNASPEQAPELVKKYINNITSYLKAGGGQEGVDLGYSVIDTAGDAVNRYILENASAIKDAVSGLTPTGFFGKKKEAPDKDTWVAEYSGQVNPEVLKDIYDYYTINSQAAPSVDPQLFFANNGNVKSVTDQELADKISSGVNEMFKYQLISSLQ